MSGDPLSIRGLVDRLRGIVGRAHVLTDPDDIAPYRFDGRGEAGGVPDAVVRPDCAEQVSALVAFAAETNLHIVVQGGRTGLMGAGLSRNDTRSGRRGDVVLNLDRLNRHIDIDPANRTATVDAGVRLSALNAAAAAHGLFFPIDLGADPSIGGMIAANTGGARLLRYGDVRANLMAIDLVRADAQGTMLSLGAPLWKNNSGLDLKQLLVGSGGSMGIVTRATVALQRLPSVQMTALVALRDAEAALPLLLELEAHFGTLLTAFEGISANAMTAALTHVPTLHAPFAAVPDYAVLIELSAGAALDAAMLEEKLGAALEPMMMAADAPIVDIAIDHRGRLWAIRHALAEGLRGAGAVVACDIALRRGDVMRFRSEMAARLAADAPALVPHDFGHIGDGGIHYNLVWPHHAGAPDQSVMDHARASVFACVVDEFGGSFSAEHGVGPRNIKHYTRFVASDVRRLSGDIQRLLAPTPQGRINFGTME